MPPQNKIRVRLSDGRTGTIDASEFDSGSMTQLPPGDPSHVSSMVAGSMQMHQGGPIITPADIHSLITSRTGMGNAPPAGTDPVEARRLAIEAGKTYPEELARNVKRETPYDAMMAPIALLSGYGTGNPIATAKGLAGSAVGAPVGAAIGRYAGGPTYGDVGAGLGGLVGGLYGGYRAMKGGPVLPMAVSKMPGMMGRIGRAFNAFAEEPGAAGAAAPAAREAAGGTAATAMPGQAAEAGAGVTGAQAGPAAPKNASELSSTVQRIRSGRGPGTAASPSPTIYTPEGLAAEQGMSTAALGKGGFNLTIPPEQQNIMRLVAEGKVPMGGAKPPSGFESLGSPEPVPSAPTTPQPTPAAPQLTDEQLRAAALRGLRRKPTQQEIDAMKQSFYRNPSRF